MPPTRSGSSRPASPSGSHPPGDRPSGPGERHGERPRREPGEDRTEPDLRPAIVGVVMGSDSDLPVVQKCLDLLAQFDIPYEASVLSAHRTPEKAHEYASTARLRGLKILIAAA